MAPKEPHLQRDLHIPVFIMRTLVVLLFGGFWIAILPYVAFTSGPSTSFGERTFSFLGLLFFGGPMFLFTFVLAMCAWEGAWNAQLQDYNAKVAAWNGYHAQIRRQRELVEQHRRDEQARVAQRQQAIRELEAELQGLRARTRELSR